jgi:hypothetical protein
MHPQARDRLSWRDAMDDVQPTRSIDLDVDVAGSPVQVRWASVAGRP